MPGTEMVPQRAGRPSVVAGIPRPEPLVVAFVSGKGGVGTSTAAAGAALALAPQMAGPTAAVSVRSGPGSLHHRLTHRTGQSARVWLTVPDSGPWQPWSPEGDLVSLVGRLRTSHPLTVLDVGDALGDAAHRVLAHADRIVLVTTPAFDAVASTATALSRVRQVDPARLATMVVAVVCLDARQHGWARRRLRGLPPLADARTVLVPFDSAVAARALPDPLRTESWRAYQRMAGLITGPGPVSGGAVSR
jgi:MinD-like ATPase involved in chromosome partitioning or flagellar assembly